MALGRPRDGTGPAAGWHWAGHIMALGRPRDGTGPATGWNWAAGEGVAEWLAKADGAKRGAMERLLREHSVGAAEL